MHKNTGLIRILRAGMFSLQGIRAAIAHEAAFRQEVLLSVVLLPLPFVFDLTAIERVLLIGVTLLVMMVELLNSAVEAVVDRISLEKHELSGRAKDMGSAAVLLSLVLWLYTWSEILVFSN